MHNPTIRLQYEPSEAVDFFPHNDIDHVEVDKGREISHQQVQTTDFNVTFK